MENKPAYLSKTVWLNTIIALAGVLGMFGILPSVHEYLQGHQDVVLMVIGAVGVGLRVVTKNSVELW